MAAMRLLLVAFVLVLVPACSDDDNGNVVVDPVGDITDQGFAQGDNIAAQAHAELSLDDARTRDGRTATILKALNDGEILQASFAVQVVGAPDVRAYANRMILDHSAANANLDAAVRNSGVSYLPSTTADMLTAEAMQGLSLLRSTPPGEIDFQYMQLQVMMHAEARVLLDELLAEVTAGPLADYIVATMTVVDAHLAEAQDLLATFF